MLLYLSYYYMIFMQYYGHFSLLVLCIHLYYLLFILYDLKLLQFYRQIFIIYVEEL